jgi:hypothetical protein
MIALATLALGTSLAVRLGACATALDALTSDLLLAGAKGCTCVSRGRFGRRWSFRCGNFGIVLLDPEFRKKAHEVSYLAAPLAC